MTTDDRMHASVTLMPNLSVNDRTAAVAFYQEAFGAVETFRVGGEEADGRSHIVAELRIGDARFIVADQSPEYGNVSPAYIGGTTVRIDLLVDDPDAVHARAVAAGATEREPVRDQNAGPRRMGVVDDPFGHRWLIGSPWDPARS